MKHLFDPDNKIMQVLTRLTDLLILSLLWTVCSIPLITIGPATAALYYVILKMTEDAESSIVRSFFRSFWKNLVQGMVLTLLCAAIGVLLYWDRGLLTQMFPGYGSLIQIIFWVLGAIFLLGVYCLFPLLARYQNSVLHTLRNAYLLAFAFLPRALLVACLNLIPFVVFLQAPSTFFRSLPGWVLVAPALIAYLCAWLLKKPLHIPSPEQANR